MQPFCQITLTTWLLFDRCARQAIIYGLALVLCPFVCSKSFQLCDLVILYVPAVNWAHFISARIVLYFDTDYSFGKVLYIYVSMQFVMLNRLCIFYKCYTGQCWLILPCSLVQWYGWSLWVLTLCWLPLAQTDVNIYLMSQWCYVVGWLDKHPFNGLFSRTAQVSRHQKCKNHSGF